MKNIVYLFAALALSSCVYPYNVEFTEEEGGKNLVIDANILLGNTSTIVLSYLEPLDVGRRGIIYNRVEGNVYLEDNTGQTYPAYDMYGVYRINPFPPKEDAQYRLTVLADGKTYRSDWIEPTAPPEITDINFTADNEVVYVNLSLRDDGQGSGYASATFEEIWKFHADFMRLYGYDPETDSVFMLMFPDDKHYWCWKKSVSNFQYSIDYSSVNGVVENMPFYTFTRTSPRNHQEYNIRIKVWNLTPEQYRYRKMLEDNERIGGDLFSPEPGEVRGNVYCESDETEKVFGYVNVSRVTMMDAKLDSRYDLWMPPKSLIDVPRDEYLMRYESGYSPVEQMMAPDGGTVVGWGLGRCYDCILAGGTLEKPSFD